MNGKIVALRPLEKGFEVQPPPSVKVLREMAEIRELKARLTAARRLKLAN
jgi:hypothetical protein